ncbi:MAG: hypothetical protein IT383_21430 [Deltaproteobacteria bacterium]|nr:hypothetical protein [Deltaproteobacteria bacterium]
MSLDVVNKRIEITRHRPVCQEDAATEIIVAAERSEKGRADGVSNAEGRAVADFYVRCVAQVQTPKVATPALDHNALNRFDAFFMAHNLPYGKNKGPMKDRVLSMLAKVPLGAPLARAPRTGSLQPLRLPDVDGTRRDAYLDIVKKQFVVRTGEGTSAQFFGPFPLE